MVEPRFNHAIHSEMFEVKAWLNLSLGFSPSGFDMVSTDLGHHVSVGISRSMLQLIWHFLLLRITSQPISWTPQVSTLDPPLRFRAVEAGTAGRSQWHGLGGLFGWGYTRVYLSYIPRLYN